MGDNARTITAITECAFGATLDGVEVETTEHGPFWIVDFGEERAGLEAGMPEGRWHAFVARLGADLDDVPWVWSGETLAEVLAALLTGADLTCTQCGGRGYSEAVDGLVACGQCGGDGSHEHADMYGGEEVCGG